MSGRIAVIILAAGEASRYGDNKLLTAHPQGDTLLEYVVQQYAPFTDLPVFVVTGCYREAVAECLVNSPVLPEVSLAHNDAWQQGMGGSIASGVKAVLHYCEETGTLSPDHFFIGLGDTPAVTTGSLRELAEKAGIFPASRIASLAEGKRMSPAIFPYSDEALLMSLSGQKGAAKLLNVAAPECFAVPHPQAALDIDTPDDWHKLNRN
ncbi:MAG: nucleotidyltransferase family protein [Pseudomonadota bacterium]|nr:nucleotidyltransferase family protein [Pseudomonadota bacterium]